MPEMRKVPGKLLSCPMPSGGDSITLDEGESLEACGKSPTREQSGKISFCESSSVHRSRFFLEHQAQSAKIVDVYDVRKEILGKGGFGAIRRARLKGLHGAWDRVVKTVEHRSTKDRLQFKREVNILRNLDHPNVCRVYETFEERHCYHLVLEFIDGRDLYGYVFDSLSNGIEIDERIAALITWQLLQGLHYCHSQNIIHRDIKPENIMVQSNPEATHDGVHIKLIDFGLAADANVLRQMPRGTFCGTYAYVAPEVTSGRQAASAASDLWAIGLVVYVLLLGDLPGDEVRHGEQPVDLSGKPLARSARQIVSGLLSIEPQGRMAAARNEMTNENSWTNAHRELARRSVSEMSWGKAKSTSSHSLSLLGSDTMSSFVAFHRSVMLHKAVITAVAMRLVDSQQVRKVQDQFIAIDLDGNGRLSKAEFRKAIADQAPENIIVDVEAWIETVFEAIDTDHSGEIEYTEFLAAALAECSSRSGAAIRAAFHVFDVDRSQKISAAEFSRVLDMMPHEILDCISKFDADGDGEIDFQEFNRLIHNKGIVKERVDIPKRNTWKLK